MNDVSRYSRNAISFYELFDQYKQYVRNNIIDIFSFVVFILTYIL